MRPAPGAQRFPRSARLTQTGEFAQMREEGKASHSRFFVLSVRDLRSSDPTRAGFITSRRVGNAVARNRVRRRLREIVRRARPELKPGFWIVLIARRPAADATYQQLHDEWLRLSNRASIVAAPK